MKSIKAKIIASILVLSICGNLYSLFRYVEQNIFLVGVRIGQEQANKAVAEQVDKALKEGRFTISDGSGKNIIFVIDKSLKGNP